MLPIVSKDYITVAKMVQCTGIFSNFQYLMHIGNNNDDIVCA